MRVASVLHCVNNTYVHYHSSQIYPKPSTHVAAGITLLFWNFRTSCRDETARRLIPEQPFCNASQGFLHFPVLVPPQRPERDQSEMPDPNTANRPVRNRAPVPTYNLKVLCGIARPTQMATQGEQTMNSTPVIQRGISSPLGSPMLSPSTPSEFDSPSHDARDFTAPHEPKYECFDAWTNTDGHYYSAPALCARGVWVGYLASDRQKKSFRGLPSYSTLKANFADMSLPWPPSYEGKASKNRDAVCAGCLGETSALIRLREVPFVKNRVRTGMPFHCSANIRLTELGDYAT
jgi:hypothetical protein